jgi:hypothetical protein
MLTTDLRLRCGPQNPFYFLKKNRKTFLKLIFDGKYTLKLVPFRVINLGQVRKPLTLAFGVFSNPLLNLKN